MKSPYCLMFGAGVRRHGLNHMHCCQPRKYSTTALLDVAAYLASLVTYFKRSIDKTIKAALLNSSSDAIPIGPGLFSDWSCLSFMQNLA